MSDSSSPVDVAPVVDVPVAAPVAAELAALLSSLVEKKPSSVADALALFEKIDLELVKWLVSELPAAEQKVVMAAKWAVAEVKQVGLTWCVPPQKA